MTMDLVTYWAGYLAQSASVQQFPPNVTVDEVILAFLGPMPDSTVETTYINSNHSDDSELGAGLCALKARSPNTRLTISLLDTPQTFWSAESFDPDAFVVSLFQKIEEWGLKVSDIYYNIDLETGGDFIPGFERLIAALKKGLSAQGITDSRISLVGYTGSTDEQAVVQCVGAELYRLSTMDYYNSAQDRLALIQTYASWICYDFSKICVLGKAPLDGDSGTPIDVMKAVVAGCSQLGGIGLWPLVFSAIAQSITTYAEQMSALVMGKLDLKFEANIPVVSERVGGHWHEVNALRDKLSVEMPVTWTTIPLEEQSSPPPVMYLQQGGPSRRSTPRAEPGPDEAQRYQSWPKGVIPVRGGPPAGAIPSPEREWRPRRCSIQ